MLPVWFWRWMFDIRGDASPMYGFAHVSIFGRTRNKNMFTNTHLVAASSRAAWSKGWRYWAWSMEKYTSGSLCFYVFLCAFFYVCFECVFMCGCVDERARLGRTGRSVADRYNSKPTRTRILSHFTHTHIHICKDAYTYVVVLPGGGTPLRREGTRRDQVMRSLVKAGAAHCIL